MFTFTMTQTKMSMEIRFKTAAGAASPAGIVAQPGITCM
jgi:hypothetical protein